MLELQKEKYIPLEEFMNRVDGKQKLKAYRRIKDAKFTESRKTAVRYFFLKNILDAMYGSKYDDAEQRTDMWLFILNNNLCVPEYMHEGYLMDYKYEYYNSKSADFIRPICCIYNAALDGHANAQKYMVSLFRNLYRTDYNRLKKFNTMSLGELIDFLPLKEAVENDDDDLYMEISNQRLPLCIGGGELMNINFDDECAAICEIEDNNYMEERKIYDTRNQIWKDSEELLECSSCKIEDLKIYNRYSCIDQAFEDIAIDLIEPLAAFLHMNIEDMLDINNNKYIKMAYVLLNHVIYDEQDEYVLECDADEEIAGFVYLTAIILMLNDKVYETNLEVSSLISAIISKNMDAAGKKTNVSVVNSSSEMVENKDKNDQNDQNEVEVLKQKIQALEQLREHNYQLYAEEREKNAVLQGKIEELEKNKEELFELRRFAYHISENEKPEKFDLKKAEEYIKDKNIVIIGGHMNWVQKLRNRFPGWNFVKPEVSGTSDVSIINKADKVYFFTDTISHSTYSRYIGALRERKVDFGYIQEVNIKKNIEYIYRDITES